jgi:hypothetical protein
LCTHAAALIFVLSGLIQIQKRIQNPFENCFENFEKKKKRVYSLLSVFGLAIRPGLPPSSPTLGLAPSTAQLHPSLLARGRPISPSPLRAMGRAQPLAQHRARRVHYSRH